MNAQTSRRDFMKSSCAAALAAATGSVLTPRVLADVPASASFDVANSPYGVCAHIGGGEEWEQAPKNLMLMKEAGIRWIRADFSWIGVERKQGEWNFDRLDKIVDDATKLGMQILPILDYSVPWAQPAFKYPDAWKEYVKRTVERYQDRLRFWEVWNEENLKGFWGEEPDPNNYAVFLRDTYKTIKEIDPELTVLYGGLAGVPADFFAKTLDAVDEEFFDVVNIHPYRGGLISLDRVATFRKDVEAFKTALKDRGRPEKPIWITEMGWATPPIYGRTNPRVIKDAARVLFGDKPVRVAFYCDPRFAPSISRPIEDYRRYLPENCAQDPAFLNSEELKKISCDDVDLLVMPPSETFPSDCFDAVLDFVKKGGTLALQGGIPFYYRSSIDAETQKYKQEEHNPNLGRELDAFRISWYAWWTREGVPETAPSSFVNSNEGVPVEDAVRYFDDKALKEGDKMISLVDGKKDDFCGSTACVYKFDSDYKGAVVVNGLMARDGFEANVSTVANQAVFLPQAMLLSFAFGVERYFWYEFHAPERDDKDPEHHFGIVGQKLEPKPGYFAYKALTDARPAGSVDLGGFVDQEVLLRHWRRPDGKHGWAIWTMRETRNLKVRISGKIDRAFDYLGQPVELVGRPDFKPSSFTIAAKPEILYVIGPETLDPHPESND